MTLNTAKRSGAHWDDMQRLFSDAEIVEISLACAMFNMINRLNDSFRTELEPEEYNRRQHRAVGVTAAALDEYACRICAAAAPPTSTWHVPASTSPSPSPPARSSACARWPRSRSTPPRR